MHRPERPEAPRLKNDIFDFIVGTSQFVNEYFLESERNDVHKKRIAKLEPRLYLGGRTVDDERPEPAGRG